MWSNDCLDLALFVFLLRVGDVSLGTLRTLAVVQGKTTMSVVMGFFEVLIWLTAVSHVFSNVQSNPLLIVAYAGGFATGIAVGIGVERLLSLGNVVLRIISAAPDDEVIRAVQPYAMWVTTFEGNSRSQSVTLFYVICARRNIRQVIEEARHVDANLFYAFEPLRSSNLELSQPLPHPTGWRAVFKKK